jgi:diguanylate cyclase (GGDEF)-like protein
MESISVRGWPVDDAHEHPSCGAEGAAQHPGISSQNWLDALSQAAAILSENSGKITVRNANQPFMRSFLVAVGAGAQATLTREWQDRVTAFLSEGRDSDSFEMRREGRLGPEYFLCTIGRLRGEEGGDLLLITAIDRTSERTTEKNLRRELLSDGLTALPNRTGFGEEIDDRLANSTWPANARFGIIAIDLSRFSRVNESLGPMAGDELLITVAKRLKSSLRQGDVLARIGGNDFAIFARLNNGLSDALHIVQRIRDALAAPIRLSDLQIRVDCAIGCALADTLEDDPDDVVRKAQAAVKIAKRSGKVEIYRAGVLREAQRRFSIESRLRDALAQGGLTLAYQPLIHLPTGEVTGFEALARWEDEELGTVSPIEFIPVA